MRDILYYSGLVIGAACAVGFLGGGSLILICYIVGELQRMGRKRMQRKKAAFETDMLQAARREMERRALRLHKEKKALESMSEADEVHFSKIQEILNES